jgi:hypothetical protein
MTSRASTHDPLCQGSRLEVVLPLDGPVGGVTVVPVVVGAVLVGGPEVVGGAVVVGGLLVGGPSDTEMTTV